MTVKRGLNAPLDQRESWSRRRRRWNRVNRIRADYLWCLLPQKKHSRVDVNNSRSNIGSTASFAKRAAKGLKELTGDCAKIEGRDGRVHLEFCVIGNDVHRAQSTDGLWSLRKLYIKFMLSGEYAKCNIFSPQKDVILTGLLNFPLGKFIRGVAARECTLCVCACSPNSRVHQMKIIHKFNVIPRKVNTAYGVCVSQIYSEHKF